MKTVYFFRVHFSELDLNIYKDVSGFEKTWGEILRCVKNLVAGSREYPDIPREER